MKKLLFMVALALTTLTASAQGESKFKVNAGVGFSNVVGSDADTKLALAYKIGIAYDIAVSENFSIIPGVELVKKGFKSDYLDGTANMFYGQIPVFFAGKFAVADGIKMAIKAGPYVSYGLFGNDIQFGTKKINVFDKDGGFKRFDAGAIGGISLDFEQFSVGLQYSRGFAKLDKGVKQYNQAFGIVFSYDF